MQTEDSILNTANDGGELSPPEQAASENKQYGSEKPEAEPQDCVDDFEIVTASQAEQNPVRLIVMDPRVQKAYQRVKD